MAYIVIENGTTKHPAHGYIIDAMWNEQCNDCSRWYERYKDARDWAMKLFAHDRKPADLEVYVSALELDIDYELLADGTLVQL